MVSSPTYDDSSKPPYPTTVVPANRRAPPLDSGHSTKISGTWTLKHNIRSPKIYEILMKIKLKGDTALDLKDFYNQSTVCINEVTRL